MAVSGEWDVPDVREECRMTPIAKAEAKARSNANRALRRTPDDSRHVTFVTCDYGVAYFTVDTRNGNTTMGFVECEDNK